MNLDIDIQLGKAYQQLGKLSNEFEQARKKMERPIDINGDGVKKLGSEFKQTALAASKLEQETKQAMAALIRAGQKGSQEYNKLEKELRQATSETKKLDSAMEEVEKSMEDAGNSTGGIAGKLKEAAGGSSVGSLLSLGTGIGAGMAIAEKAVEAVTEALTGAWKAGQELYDTLRKVQARTGLNKKEMQEFKSAAIDAYKHGLGDSVADAVEIMSQAKLQLKDTFSSTAELAEFTTRAAKLGEVFDKDVNEVIRLSAPFIKQFGLDGEEAYNLIAKGLQEGTTAQDDYLDSLAEYSQLAVQAGYSAEQFTNLLTTGAQEGVFNTDKIADSLKETQIRLKAGDFENAFKGLGAGATEAETQIIKTVHGILQAGKDGSITVKETLQQTTAAIEEGFEGGKISETLRTQLQVAIAGTPAEDLGSDVYARVFGASVPDTAINESAQNIGDGIEAAVEKTPMEKVGRGLMAGITAGAEAVYSAFQDIMGFLIDIIDFLIDIIDTVYVSFYEGFLKGIIEGFEPLFDAFGELYDAIADLFSIFDSGSESAFNLGEIMSTLGHIIGTVLGVAIKIITTPLKLVLKLVTQMYKWVKQLIVAMIDFGRTSDVIQTIAGAFKSVFKWIGKVVTKVLEFFGLMDKEVPTAPFKETGDSAKDLGEAIDETNENANTLNKTLNKPTGAGLPIKKAETLAEKLKEAEDALFKLYKAGQQNTDEFDNLLEKTRQIKKEIAETKAGEAWIKTLLSIDPDKIDFSSIDETSTVIANELVTGIENKVKDIPFEYKPMDVDVGIDDIFSGIDFGKMSSDFISQSIAELFETEQEDAKETTKVLNKEYGAQQDLLKAKLNAHELSYESYRDNLKEADEKYLQGLQETEQSAQSTWESIGAISIQVAVDTLNKMIPIWVASIFGQEVSKMGIAGLATAAALTAALMGLSQAAQSSLGAEEGYSPFEGKGYGKKGKSDTVPVWVNPNEAILTASQTARNKEFIQHIRAGGIVDLNTGLSVNVNSDLSISELRNIRTELKKAKLVRTYQNNKIIIEDNRAVKVKTLDWNGR